LAASLKLNKRTTKAKQQNHPTLTGTPPMEGNLNQIKRQRIKKRAANLFPIKYQGKRLAAKHFL
jgi:hypothetical protein